MAVLFYLLSRRMFCSTRPEKPSLKQERGVSERQVKEVILHMLCRSRAWQSLAFMLEMVCMGWLISKLCDEILMKIFPSLPVLPV